MQGPPSPTPDAPLPESTVSSAQGPLPARRLSGASTAAISAVAAATPLASDSASWPVEAPRRIGKYELLEQLGAGGMGVVFKAWDSDLKRIVAVKMIRSGFFASENEIGRFLREREALARIKHPRIVPIHDGGSDSGQPYFVLEYLGGGSLHAQRRRFRDDPRAAAGLVEKIARAVHEVHKGGMLHRDLKPSNILFDDEGQPYLADFGLIKLLDESNTELTRTNQRLGTPAYMSPEQAGLAHDTIGTAADIWSLGVILYELVSGNRPFQGAEHAELFHNILCHCPPPPSTSMTSPGDGGLDRIILKCLEKDPRDRFGDAEELADELGRWLRGEPLRTQPERWGQRWRRLMRRNPGRTAAAALAALLLMGGLIAGLLYDPQRGLRALEKELAGGRPVVLIDDAKWPLHLVDLFQAKGNAHRAEDGSFLLQSWEMGLWELAPQSHQKAYRLKAKIRHINAGIQGRVGFFFARRSVQVAKGPVDHYFEFTFNDVHDMRNRPGGRGALDPPSNHASAESVIHARLDTIWENIRGIAATPGFAATGLRGNRWRDLVVEVHPDRIDGWFDGDPLAPHDAPQEVVRIVIGTLAEIEAEGHDLSFLEGFTPTYHPAGSFGLYLRQGSAAFRDVIFEPMTLPKE